MGKVNKLKNCLHTNRLLSSITEYWANSSYWATNEINRLNFIGWKFVSEIKYRVWGRYKTAVLLFLGRKAYTVWNTPENNQFNTVHKRKITFPESFIAKFATKSITQQLYFSLGVKRKYAIWIISKNMIFTKETH